MWGIILWSLTYLLTPWSRVLLEKPNGFKPVKKFPAFHGTWRFIAAFTSARHLLSSIQPIPPHPISWRTILILSSHLCLGLPSLLQPLCTQTWSLCPGTQGNTPCEGVSMCCVFRQEFGYCLGYLFVTKTFPFLNGTKQSTWMSDIVQASSLLFSVFSFKVRCSCLAPFVIPCGM
jgi:hypothetical protein